MGKNLFLRNRPAGTVPDPSQKKSCHLGVKLSKEFDRVVSSRPLKNSPQSVISGLRGNDQEAAGR